MYLLNQQNMLFLTFFKKTLTKINIAPYDTEDEPETKGCC